MGGEGGVIMKYEESLLPATARRLYLTRLASLGIARRVEIVSELRESARLVAREMIEASSPALSAEEVERELRRRAALHVPS